MLLFGCFPRFALLVAPTVATAGAATAAAATTAFATPTLAATTITGGHTYLG